MKLTINCFSIDDIKSAKDAVDNYRNNLGELTRKIISGVVERAKSYAIENLTIASTMSREMATEVANTIPTITTEFVQDNIAIIRAGGDAIWLEFGSGVHYNGAKGSMPHPKAQDVEGIVPIGTYGLGKGANDYWIYYDGEKFKTSHGTQCTQFMYRALLKVQEDIPQIIGELIK